MPPVPAAPSLGELPGRAAALARQDPLVVAVAVAVALAVLIAVGLYVRRLRRPPGAWFRRALAKPDSVSVLMHPNPDPDAMAAALGVAHVAERADTDATIHYPGQIRHQENRAFQTVLDLDFRSIESAADLDDTVVLVDHNEPRGFEGAERTSPYAVVDHHPGDGAGNEFTDVRPDYGACATIVAEYLDELGERPADPDDDNEAEGFPTEVATGLMYGILADTSHLTRGPTGAEFDASAYLHPGVDEDALDRIANPQVDAEVLDVVARAISNREVRGPFAVSDVGEVSNLDAIPQAADDLLTLEGVTAVVVFGEKAGTLHLSGRSRDDRVHMGNALDAAVEDIAHSGAGGHARMGGGQVSVTHLEGLRPESGMTREEFAEEVFAALAGDI